VGLERSPLLLKAQGLEPPLQLGEDRQHLRRLPRDPRPDDARPTRGGEDADAPELEGEGLERYPPHQLRDARRPLLRYLPEELEGDVDVLLLDGLDVRPRRHECPLCAPERRLERGIVDVDGHEAPVCHGLEVGEAANDFNPSRHLTCMEPLAVALILVSAASHAAWNYLAKGARDKDSFLLLMNVTSQVTLLPVFILLLRDWTLPLSVVPFLVASAVAEAVYFLALSRAYDAGDLSIVYPVARSAPLFVAVAGAVFLGDPLTTAGLAGILLVLAGVYILHLKSLKLSSLLEPLRSFKGPAFGFALIAAVGTTAYSLSDKVAVTRVDPVLYDLWLEVAITLVLTPIVLRSRGWGNIRAEWGNTWRRITVAGALMRGGYLLVLVAMTLAPVGYLLAFRQISVVIGALLGLIILREGYGAPRILGSATIFAGVYIIATLA